MQNEIIPTATTIATDWWIFGATIFGGILTALATMWAVIYSNKKTREQIYEQNIKNERERKEQNKLEKMVVIKPIHMVNSFNSLLDMMIVQNNWDRILLFSGEDGFEFYDDQQKRSSQQCRILLIENKSDYDIKSIKLTTKSLLSTVSDERIVYKTENYADFLRSKEDIAIRILNQTQYEKIVQMHKDGISSEIDFECIIEYSTLANQRVRYVYKINIKNDKRIEILKDEVESVIDLDDPVSVVPSIFRNLQDSISGVDRAAYSWEKIGYAQMRGALAQFNPTIMQQNAKPDGTSAEKRSNE